MRADRGGWVVVVARMSQRASDTQPHYLLTVEETSCHAADARERHDTEHGGLGFYLCYTFREG